MNKRLARRLARRLALPPALFALACALLAPAAAGSAAAAPGPRRAAQEPRLRPEPASDSTVRGRALYDDTRRPVRRARLVLMAEGGTRTELSTLTDARGEFRIRKVPAGRYYAFVDVPGVLSPATFLSMGRPGSVADERLPDLGEGRVYFDPIEVDGKAEVEVTVRAYRGATLAGRVTHADGDPAVNVAVSLLRRGAGGRLLRFFAGTNITSLSALRTDDRGMFRLTGLPPGEYVVGVSESVNHGASGAQAHEVDMPGVTESMLGQHLVLTFHPSAASAKEAAVVKVAAGEERADVDVRIPERELHSVSGVVRARRGGLPLAGARVAIVRRDDPRDEAGMIALQGAAGTALNATRTDGEGRWQFREIPDGAYTLSVKPADEYEPGAPGPSLNMSGPMLPDVRELPSGRADDGGGRRRAPRRKRAYAPLRRDVEVSGGDLSEVLIEAIEGGRIAGAVTDAGGEPIRYAHVVMMGVAEGGDDSPAGYITAGVFNDGRFGAEGLSAGRFIIHANAYEAEKLYLKSITWNGKDLLREPLELGEGADVEGVRIVFARDGATLRLTARAANGGKPAPRTNLYLLPADSSAWQLASARKLLCTTGEDGSCPLLAPPGEYRVVALPPNLRGDSFEAEIRRRAPSAPRLSLRPGEKREFEVAVPDR